MFHNSIFTQASEKDFKPEDVSWLFHFPSQMSLASVTFLFVSYDVQVSEIRKEHNSYDDLFSGSSCIGTVEWQHPLFSLYVIDNIQ